MAQQQTSYPHATGNARQQSQTATEKIDVEEIAGKVMQQARDLTEQAQQAVNNFKPFVEKSMKEQPMATLAVAALIGAALGAIWKK
jgi:ElaB/YqjD/DUF883 family membrane-anchored ribosome-binding protein